jgi:hypothetical protein
MRKSVVPNIQRPEETPAIAMFKLRIVLRLLAQADF